MHSSDYTLSVYTEQVLGGAAAALRPRLQELNGRGLQGGELITVARARTGRAARERPGHSRGEIPAGVSVSGDSMIAEG